MAGDFFPKKKNNPVEGGGCGSHAQNKETVGNPEGVCPRKKKKKKKVAKDKRKKRKKKKMPGGIRRATSRENTR